MFSLASFSDYACFGLTVLFFSSETVALISVQRLRFRFDVFALVSFKCYGARLSLAGRIALLFFEDPLRIANEPCDSPFYRTVPRSHASVATAPALTHLEDSLCAPGPLQRRHVHSLEVLVLLQEPAQLRRSRRRRGDLYNYQRSKSRR